MAFVEIEIQIPQLNGAKPSGITWTVYGRQAVLDGGDPTAGAHSGGDPAPDGDFVSNLGPQAMSSANATKFQVRMDNIGYSEPDGGSRQATFTWRTCWFALDVETRPAVSLEDRRETSIADHKEKVGNYIVLYADNSTALIY